MPGMTGVSVDTSLGVAEKAFPSRSTTATYEVPRAAGLPAWAATAVAAGRGTGARPATPAGGIAGQARRGVDEPPARGAVGRVDEAGARDLDVARVAVEGLAVGEGELHRLRDRVDVVRRVVPEPGEVDPLEDLEHLEEHRALAPEAAGHHRA